MHIGKVKLTLSYRMNRRKDTQGTMMRMTLVNANTTTTTHYLIFVLQLWLLQVTLLLEMMVVLLVKEKLGPFLNRTYNSFDISVFFTIRALLEAQEIFGVDFNPADFGLGSDEEENSDTNIDKEVSYSCM